MEDESTGKYKAKPLTAAQKKAQRELRYPPRPRWPSAKGDRNHIRFALANLSEKLPSHQAFIFIRQNRDDFRLVFPNGDRFEPITSAMALMKNLTEIAVEAEHLGIRIRNLRMQRGWTQRDLAGQLGVPHQNISEIETGRRRVGRRLAQRMLDLLAGPARP